MNSSSMTGSGTAAPLIKPINKGTPDQTQQSSSRVRDDIQTTHKTSEAKDLAENGQEDHYGLGFTAPLQLGQKSRNSGIMAQARSFNVIQNDDRNLRLNINQNKSSMQTTIKKENEQKTFGRSASLQELRQNVPYLPPDESSSNQGGVDDIRVKQSRNGSAIKYFFNKYLLCHGTKNKYQVVEPGVVATKSTAQIPTLQSAQKPTANSCLPFHQISSYFNKRNSSQTVKRGEGDFLRRGDSIDSADKQSTKNNQVSLKHGGCKIGTDDPYQNGIKITNKGQTIGKSLLKQNQSQALLPEIKNQNNAVVAKKLAHGGQSKYSQQLKINFKPKDTEQQRGQLNATQTVLTAGETQMQGNLEKTDVIQSSSLADETGEHSQSIKSHEQRQGQASGITSLEQSSKKGDLSTAPSMPVKLPPLLANKRQLIDSSDEKIVGTMLMDNRETLNRTMAQRSERLHTANSPTQTLKGKRIMSTKGNREKNQIKEQADGETQEDKFEKLTDQPSQATIDLSLLKIAAGKDFALKKRKSEDLGKISIETHGRIDESVRTIKIAASEALTPKSEGLSTPKAVSYQDEKNLSGIEQIINFNIQKIATIFDDIHITDQQQSAVATDGRNGQSEKQSLRSSTQSPQSLLRKHIEKVINNQTDSINQSQNGSVQNRASVEEEPANPTSSESSPSKQNFTPKQLNELQNRINATIDRIKQIKVKQQEQKVQESPETGSKGDKKLEASSAEDGDQAASHIEIMEEVKKLIQIQDELLRYTIVSEHSLLTGEAINLQIGGLVNANAQPKELIEIEAHQSSVNSKSKMSEKRAASEKDDQLSSPQTSNTRSPKTKGLDNKDLNSQSEHHQGSSSSLNVQEEPEDESDINIAELDKKNLEKELEILQLVSQDHQLSQEIQRIENAKVQREKATKIIETLIKLKESQHHSSNASIGRQNLTKMRIIDYLQTNLELNELNIIKNYSPKRRIFCATQYYNGITELIHDRFGEPGMSITDEQFNLIYSILAYFCQSQKNQHHNLLLNILSYLPLEVLVMKISLLNRKLYIVSGDMRLLQNYWNKNNSYLLDGPINNGNASQEDSNQEISFIMSDGEDNSNERMAAGADGKGTPGSNAADGKKAGQQHLQMIEEELSDDDQHSNSIQVPQNKQDQDNAYANTEPPEFAQVTCYNDILSESKVSTANFHYEQEVPNSTEINKLALQQLDVFSFGGEKQQNRNRVGNSFSSVDSPAMEIDYCDISSIKDQMHLLHNSIKSSQAAQRRKHRNDAYLDDGVPESLTFSLGNKGQHMAKKWRKRKELVSESDEESNSNAQRRIASHNQDSQAQQQQQSLVDNIIINDGQSPYHDLKFRSNTNRINEFNNSSDANYQTNKTNSSISKSDRKYMFESPNLLLNNLKQSKKKNLGGYKQERVSSLQAPPNLASKIDSSTVKNKRSNNQQTKQRGSAQQKGGNVHGSVEGMLISTEKTKVDLRKLSCSTLDKKKRISQQINFSMRKIHDEKRKDDIDQLNEGEQIMDKDEDNMDEMIRRNNTVNPVDNLKLPDEKLFTSSLQEPERKQINQTNNNDNMIILDKQIVRNYDNEKSPSQQSMKSLLSNSNHITSSQQSLYNKNKDISEFVALKNYPTNIPTKLQNSKTEHSQGALKQQDQFHSKKNQLMNRTFASANLSINLKDGQFSSLLGNSKQCSDGMADGDTQGISHNQDQKRIFRKPAIREEQHSHQSKYILTLNKNNSQLGVHEQMSNQSKKEDKSHDSEYGM